MNASSSSIEIWADEIASPLDHSFSKPSVVRKIRPARILISKSSGKILNIGSLSKSKLQSRSRKVLRGQTIVPGFVDAHTHLIFAGNRAEEWGQRLQGVSYQQIARDGGGIRTTVRATRGASDLELLKISKKRLERCLSLGITTLEIKTGYGLDLRTELRLLDLIRRLKRETPIDIAATFMPAHALPPEFKSTKSYVDHILADILPSARGRAEFQDVFCEAGYFSVQDSIRLLEAGKKFGLLPKVHAHEFGRTGGVEVARKVGAISADHLMVVNEADIKGLKKAKVIPVILSGTSFFLNKPFAPAKKMIEAGLPVAIASDFNPGTNPSQNLLLAGSFAAIYQGLSLDRVLAAQTLHAAWAVNRKDRGSLEKGKRADLAHFETRSFEEIYYRYGEAQSSWVMVNGRKISTVH